ncbi:uncharacterized protein UV8b_01816 [Ustilaginoidea virens]|uniref:Uncharacterized protein n=1 Tax=Ustilaginoidea virens TaxID=1159556 RepID=A0A063BID0_USTVR|nr:uncharacterized protein UV8b_01816 [Ustilaginoidea virens]QUC17575.1 hypothetical protein UV8b_01816 [Ustilaginoidea virens]GAO19821.1 hypothetical protein UVI_02059220 [Ustilaginoidea virens]
MGAERCSQMRELLANWPWAAEFASVFGFTLLLGFGPVGIGAGSLAAAFQSYMYGAFTPAGSLFATLTSFGMRGLMVPVAAGCAAVATAAWAILKWAWSWVGGAFSSRS